MLRDFKDRIHEILLSQYSLLLKVLAPEQVFKFGPQITLGGADLAKSLLRTWVLEDCLAGGNGGEATSRHGHGISIVQVSWDVLALSDSVVDGGDSFQAWLAEEMTLLAKYLSRWLLLGIVHAQVADITSHINGILRCRSLAPECVLVVLNAVRIHIVVIQVLSAESANQIELLQLCTVPIDKLGPLVHLVPGLLVELVLEIVIFLLKLLRELVDHIVLELQQLPLLLIVVHQDSPLGKLPRQVVGQYVDFNFEVLGHRILYVVVQLAVFVQELQLIRPNTIPVCRSLATHRLRCHLSVLLRCISRGDLFHGHEDFVYSCYVFLNLRNIILQNS